MSNTTEQSTLPAVIEAAVQAKLMTIHTGLVGRVVEFYPQRGTIDVQALPTLLDSRGTARVLPVLQDVPFVYPRAGTFKVTWPLSEGDAVWLVFGERDLSAYLTGGQEVTANPVRTPLGSCVAMPGPWPLSDATIQSGGVRVEYAGTRVEITTSGDVQIDAGARKVALGNDIGEALEKVSDALGAASDALNTIINASFPPPLGQMDPAAKITATTQIASLDAATGLLDQIRGPLT